ncbi:MAG TPA: hypothetical protein VN700_11740 [Vicinamibacterales bacterium]|nr:hypothetical protein [Vicinamibacterales bacterium]
MRCPVCGTEYAFFERKCTRCDADLIDPDAEADGAADEAAHGAPDTHLVSVFKTSDPAVLPLATMALEAEGIEYLLRNAGKSDSLQWMMSQDPTNRPMAIEIHVASDVAAKARDLLVDLENPGQPIVTPDAADSPALTTPEPPAAMLEDAVTGEALGTITEYDLQEITSRLEEEQPHQYFITGETVDMLKDARASAALVDLLRRAVGADGSGRVIRWVVK